MGKFPRKVMVYVCNTCGAEHEEREEAEDCCPPEVDEIEKWQCSQCDTIHDEKEDAYNCCG